MAAPEPAPEGVEAALGPAGAAWERLRRRTWVAVEVAAELGRDVSRGRTSVARLSTDELVVGVPGQRSTTQGLEDREDEAEDSTYDATRRG